LITLERFSTDETIDPDARALVDNVEPDIGAEGKEESVACDFTNHGE
jgi:hypothetical protein